MVENDSLRAEWPEDSPRARVILEVMGKPKQHVASSLKEYIQKIEKDESYQISDLTTKPPKKIEGDMFSSFSEFTLQTKTLPGIFNFCMDYMPASIEIEQPQRIPLTRDQLSDLANDFIAHLHNVDLVLKGLRQKNAIMGESIGILVQNAILILLNLGPQNTEQIGNHIGIDPSQITKFTDKLEKDNKIIKKGDLYYLADGNTQ